MQEGAWGMSTGLDYPPGQLRRHRGAASISAARLRASAASTTPTFGIALATCSSIPSARRSTSVGAAASPPTSPHFYHRITARRRPPAADLVEDARDDGLDVTFDSYPYIFCSTRLAIVLPQWALDGGPDPLRAVPSPSARPDRMRKECARVRHSWRDMWLTLLQAPRQPSLRGPHDRRGGRDDGPG